jgi:hypothetical protein
MPTSSISNTRKLFAGNNPACTGLEFQTYDDITPVGADPREKPVPQRGIPGSAQGCFRHEEEGQKALRGKQFPSDGSE